MAKNWRSNAGAELANRVQYPIAEKRGVRTARPLFNEVPTRQHVTPGHREHVRKVDEAAKEFARKPVVRDSSSGPGSPLGGQAQVSPVKVQAQRERAAKLKADDAKRGW
jgi:hypothetical protein